MRGVVEIRIGRIGGSTASSNDLICRVGHKGPPIELIEKIRDVFHLQCRCGVEVRLPTRVEVVDVLVAELESRAAAGHGVPHFHARDEGISIRRLSIER